ncbi:hypothetical protein SAMN04515674_102114 [Pseudarcicella hirudinis]|uniref:Uncharacterized protein n=1 Tax=Pseudarcicella hirudinis TaxID=1079859 RepID=A0A1I5NTP1_9BACT|nr:hypothetical protein [Pseudarcicella hirudinis]SFP25154.1 hypothetical protein SAMN04515674_102114 [Pseudarcicella hirudinis]
MKLLNILIIFSLITGLTSNALAMGFPHNILAGRHALKKDSEKKEIVKAKYSTKTTSVTILQKAHVIRQLVNVGQVSRLAFLFVKRNDE